MPRHGIIVVAGYLNAYLLKFWGRSPVAIHMSRPQFPGVDAVGVEEKPMPQLYQTIASAAHDNASYIDRHNCLFDVEPSHLLSEFERFAGWARGWGIESSCKVVTGQLNAARFVLFRSEPSATEYQAVLAFFRRVETQFGVRLDHSCLDRFVGNRFDPKNLSKIALGIDARRDSPALKFFIFPRDWPEIRARAVSYCEERDDLNALIAHADSWCTGFDLHLHGRCEFEVYLNFTESLNHKVTLERLAVCLPPSTQPWIAESNHLICAFSPGRSERVLYFRPLDPDTFIAKLGNEQAKSVHARYRGLSPLAMMVGLPERQLCNHVADAVTLYYYSDDSVKLSEQRSE